MCTLVIEDEVFCYLLCLGSALTSFRSIYKLGSRSCQFGSLSFLLFRTLFPNILTWPGCFLHVFVFIFVQYGIAREWSSENGEKNRRRFDYKW